MSQQKHSLMLPGGGERLRFLDDSELIIMAIEEPMAHYEYVAKPAAKGSPQHIHQRHDETFYVAEGEFEFSLGPTTVAVGSGRFFLSSVVNHMAFGTAELDQVELSVHLPLTSRSTFENLRR